MSGAIVERNRRLNAATATGTPARDFSLEQLEPRRLFSGPVIAVTLADGIVSIHGTEGRDLVIVQQLADWNGNPTIALIYQSYSHGSDGGFGIAGGVAYFNRGAIKEIHFDGGDGDDIAYSLNAMSIVGPPVENVDVPLLLDGGEGNDTLLGGAGDDTIIGGAGEDWIEGGAISNGTGLFFSYWTGSDNGLKSEQFALDSNGNMVGGSAGHDLLIADVQAADVVAAGSANVPALVAASTVVPTVPVAPGVADGGSLSSFFKDEESGLLN